MILIFEPCRRNDCLVRLRRDGVASVGTIDEIDDRIEPQSRVAMPMVSQRAFCKG